MKKKLLALFLSMSSFCCFAETYKIKNYIWNLEGKTDSFFLERRIKAEKEIEFSNKKDLENYIDDLKKKCSNLRLFEELKSELEIEPSEIPDCLNVVVKIHAKESRSSAIVPYPKYSSTEGFKIKTKLKDMNFQGKTNSLEAEAAFIMQKKTYEENFRPGVGGALKYSMPFYVGNAFFSWNNVHEISYIKDDPLPEWNLKSGISFSYPFEKFDVDFSAHQIAVRDSLYEKYDDEIYFSENAEFSVPVKIYKCTSFGEIKYAPGTSVEWIWNKKGVNERTEDLTRQELLGFHKIYAGSINWEGNFRNGFSFELKHSAGFNFYNEKSVHGIEFDFAGHVHNERIGLNFRTKDFYYKNKKLRIGNYLRGIADDMFYSDVKAGYDDFFACSTNAAFVFNIDVPVKLFEIDFGESSLKLLNCEVQFSPFVDFALCYNKFTDRYFNPKDGFYCAGFEVLVFPKKFKSMQARLSGGIDLSRTLLKDYTENSWKQKKISKYEITFGFDLYF